jgi:CBS domain-containing protein
MYSTSNQGGLYAKSTPYSTISQRRRYNDPNPVTVASTSTVQDATDLMVAADTRHLPVVMHEILVGMLSDRDLRSYMLPRPEKILHADEAQARMADSVSAVMRVEVITVRPDAPLATLLDILLQENIGAVPVLAPDTGELLGMVSYVDVLRAIRPFV